MELTIVTYIKTYGLEKAVKDFKLKMKDYGHKVLLKYDQIESDMGFSEVQDCRGLILEKGTWKVMSLAFRKFFNSAESYASKIDWSTAIIFDKCDGSLIQVYWDWVLEKWCAGTSGMAEGEGEVNEKPNTSFASLFWKVFKEVYNGDTDKLAKGCTYAFELMTPYNIVVKPHGTSTLALLGVRDLSHMVELPFKTVQNVSEIIGIPTAKVWDINASNVGHLLATFEGMPFTEEGYVVCDGKFNRIKLKNPAYVAAHHLKSKTGLHHIMTIVKANEVEEYASTFPERKDEIFDLKDKYDTLVTKLEDVWEELIPHKPKNIMKKEQKKYAMKVFEIAENRGVKSFHGLFFALKDGKTPSVKDYMSEFSDKALYEMFT